MCGPAVVVNRTVIFGISLRRLSELSRLRRPRMPGDLTPGAAPRPRGAPVEEPALSAVEGPPQLASGAPKRRLPCQSISCTRAPSSRISSFSQGTEPNPLGDMLSPKIGVTVTAYSPSDGNTWRTSRPPRVPNGSPSMW